MPVQVRHTELSEAFEFISFGPLYELGAWVSLDTGKVYWQSDQLGSEEDLPEDLETSDRYIAVPHKNKLGLGRDLALSFADQELPDDYETVAGFFRRKGAYGRFKDLLFSRGMLQRWYDYESRATDEALRAWCEENDLELVDDRPAKPPDRA